MGRIPQGVAKKGSQAQLQRLVERQPQILDAAIGLGPLTWLSPVAADGYAEYRDGAFLKLLGIELKEEADLSSFWPAGGPVWDGLAKTSDGTPVLVEAKSHPHELDSVCKASSPRSCRMIAESLRQTQASLAVESTHDWTRAYYQYANRLAHAYLLNELNGFRSELVFLYFIGDYIMDGPDWREAWETELRQVHRTLGIKHLPGYVREVFVSVEPIHEVPVGR